MAIGPHEVSGVYNSASKLIGVIDNALIERPEEYRYTTFFEITGLGRVNDFILAEVETAYHKAGWNHVEAKNARDGTFYVRLHW